MLMHIYVKGNVMTPAPYQVDAQWVRETNDGTHVELVKSAQVRDENGNLVHVYTVEAIFKASELEMITTGRPGNGRIIWKSTVKTA